MKIHGEENSMVMKLMMRLMVFCSQQIYCQMHLNSHKEIMKVMLLVLTVLD